MADADQHVPGEPQAPPDEPEAEDEPLFVPQPVPERETIDLEEAPEKEYLETTCQWVRKDRVPQTIREQYCKIIRRLGINALKGTHLKGRLEDYTIAASRASPGKLIQRHTRMYWPALKEARAAAEKEVQKGEKMMDLAEWQDDINAVADIQERAEARYQKACQGVDRAAALIKDLKAHLAKGA